MRRCSRCKRSREGTLNSRYFWPDANTVVIVGEIDHPRRVYGGEPSADGARIQFSLADLADRTAFEIWSGAREGTDQNQLAGR